MSGVNMEWFYRWLYLNKARRSRDLWDVWNASKGKHAETPDETQARLWAMLEDKY